MGVIFLGSYLCISILEFKYQNAASFVKGKFKFMYFYIRI